MRVSVVESTPISCASSVTGPARKPAVAASADAAPRTRATFTASWDTTQWSLLARVSRHGSAKRVFNFGGGFEPEQTYGAEWQLDAEVEYRVSPKWSVALGGLNLTDEYPDLSSADISYFGNLPYDVLSPIGSNGAYYYTRVRYTF